MINIARRPGQSAEWGAYLLLPNFPVIIILAFLIVGCGASPDTVRIGQIDWRGREISFELQSSKQLPGMVEVECLNCNLIEGYYTVRAASGLYSVSIPQAAQLAMTELSIKGAGIDTLVQLLMPAPESAAKLYDLPKPLIGRVRAGAFSNLYFDRNIDSLATGVVTGTELNLYSDSGLVYEVHHPNYTEPLFMPHSFLLRLY